MLNAYLTHMTDPYTPAIKFFFKQSRKRVQCDYSHAGSMELAITTYYLLFNVCSFRKSKATYISSCLACDAGGFDR